MHPGPRPSEDEAVLGAIREALKAGRALSFRYEGGRTPGQGRTVTPYGLLFGRSNYLVASEGEGEPRNWRLDRLRDVSVSDAAAFKPEDFSLQAYADRSFGIYQDDPEDVELLFAKGAADAALRWRFHVGQAVAQEADGRVRVSFRASGMGELAHHLFTWGDQVEIVRPSRLKMLLVQQLETALCAHTL